MAVYSLALLACGGEGTPFSPTVETVAGNYHAITLTAIQGSSSTNLLLGGGSLTLNLLGDGTTDNTVTFDQPDSDTFIRDMTFIAERNRLRGEEDFGGFTIRVVRSK